MRGAAPISWPPAVAPLGRERPRHFARRWSRRGDLGSLPTERRLLS